MTISFKPALGETLHVPVLPPPLTSAIPLQFYAKLSNQDYDALKLNGAKLQLWSDIVSSDWSSLDFKDVEEDIGSYFDMATVALIDPGLEEHRIKRKLMILQFSVSIPPQGIGPYSSDFSFTYRIFYPNGDLTWLGDYQHDGSLILGYNGVSHPGFSLKQGWSRDLSGDGGVYSLDDYAKDKEIAELVIPSYYRAWAIGKDNFLSGTTNASLLFLVPYAQKLSLVLTQTYVLCVTPGVTVSLSDDDLITATGRGRVFLWIYNLRSGNISKFIDKMRTYCPPEMCQLLIAKPDTGHLLVLSPMRHNIIAAVIISLAPDGWSANARVTIALEVLSMPLQRSTSQFAVFCPLNSDVRFFPSSSAFETENIISFVVAAHGSQFCISAVADLGTTHGRSWRASLLSPHSNPQFPMDDALPTPPPFPIIRTNIQLELELESLTSVTRQGHVPTATITDPSSALVVRPNEPSSHAALALKYMVTFMTTVFYLVLALIWKRPIMVLKQEDEQNKAGARKTTADKDNDKDALGSGGDSLESGADIVASELGTGSNERLKHAKVDSPSGQPTFYAEVPGSKVVVAVHVQVDRSTSAPRAEDVSKMIELDGHVPECTVRKHHSPGDMTEHFLLEFEGGKGGRIKISPAISTSGNSTV